MQKTPLFTFPETDTDTQRMQGFPRAAQVIACWHAARRARPVPLRRDIAPAPLGEALAQCFIAALVSPRVARLRIAGSGLHDLMGMDVRGMPLTAFFDTDARRVVMQATEQLCSGARVALPMVAERGLRRPPMEGLLVMLPLSSDGNGIDMVLGALDTVGVTGTPPRRFATAKPTPAAFGQRTAPLAQILQDRMPVPAAPERTGRPHGLRVIDGGRY